MSILASIKSQANSLSDQLITIRRHIHSHPELSFKEFETVAYVRAQLEAMGITQIKEMAVTGLEVLIEGKNPSFKTIALRADMDALPIIEANEVEYKSKNHGVMHACGHDVHTTCLLGVAKLLMDHKDLFEGTFKLIFQPGEEKLPGGASLMIQEGILENPTVNTILGQHVMPLIPVGKVGFRSGLYMASTDELYVTVKGKGGHGAMPHLCIDPIAITAQMITALQQLVSRQSNPIIPSVLSFGKVIANGATNVIPNEVYLEGTFRTLDENWRAKAHELMLRTATSIAEGFGGSVDFEIRKGYPFLKNNPEVTARAKTAAQEYLGIENVLDLDIWMAAEDFSYYSQVAPACFYRLGTRNESRGIISGVHTPTFDIDEDALALGSGLMAYLAIQEMGSSQTL
ncbi:MAG: N-acyl-L-amino acid amidohydrolase [Bacteroidetes bacterium B1(2017)]|nr:MAG: N-acyl-L-amino acid amidohydrolase [Bacteroidetes bacterium B1(2017)]